MRKELTHCTQWVRGASGPSAPSQASPTLTPTPTPSCPFHLLSLTPASSWLFGIPFQCDFFHFFKKKLSPLLQGFPPGHLFGSPQDPISQICVGQGMTQAEYMNFRTLGKHRDTLKKKKSPVVSHLQHALMYLILSLNLSY